MSLEPAVTLTARSPNRLFRLLLESHDGRCYGAAARILHPSSLMGTDGAPHAEVERPEAISHRPRTGRHANRGHRDEPIKLARCRHRAWRRAPAVEEARGRCEHIAEDAVSMAG